MNIYVRYKKNSFYILIHDQPALVYEAFPNVRSSDCYYTKLLNRGILFDLFRIQNTKVDFNRRIELVGNTVSKGIRRAP